MCFLWSPSKCMQPHCYFKAYKQDISAVNDSSEKKSWELYKQKVMYQLFLCMTKCINVASFWFLTDGLFLQRNYGGIHKLASWAYWGGTKWAPSLFSCPHIYLHVFPKHTYRLLHFSWNQGTNVGGGGVAYHAKITASSPLFQQLMLPIILTQHTKR